VIVDPLIADDGGLVLRWLYESNSPLSIVLISGLINGSSFGPEQSPTAPIVERPHEVSALLTMLTDAIAGSLSRDVIRERTG
jgi:hypothetical protein